MRADSLSPKTWLLAGIAGWAVCLWVFALLGLGEHLGDAGIAETPQPLPSTTIPRADRPGPQAQYAEIGVRPIFSENRKPQPFRIDGTGEEAQVNTFDYTLTSVMIASGVQLAILKPTADGAQPVRVKVGDAVETAPQWTLASLLPRSATFRGPEGEKVLELRVFNGVGGAMPPPPNALPSVAAGPGGVINQNMPGQPPGGEQPMPPQSAPFVPPPPPVASSDSDAANVSTQAQLDAIRKRIEARRAQLRQQATQEAQNPAPPPGQSP
jgi:general secretion pathway protein N